ncbi:hypothetical protein [Chryseobacterium wanjuense]
MKKLSIYFILFLGVAEVSAQKDSIYIEARLSSDKKTLDVNQDSWCITTIRGKI